MTLLRRTRRMGREKLRAPLPEVATTRLFAPLPEVAAPVGLEYGETVDSKMGPAGRRNADGRRRANSATMFH
ncbi:MAG: hypothetical protein WAK03_06720 [Methylocystis sp.]